MDKMYVDDIQFLKVANSELKDEIRDLKNVVLKALVQIDNEKEKITEDAMKNLHEEVATLKDLVVNLVGEHCNSQK